MRRKGIIEQLAVAERQAEETAVYYPDCDGEPMAENNLQQRAICYASGALRAHFRDRPDVHVRGDMFLYYRNGRPRKSIVPDVFVVFGDVEVPQTSYKVWEVGVVPQFVLEVASKSTHLRDRDTKTEAYERLRVQEYWRFDPTGELFRPPEYGECVLGQRLGAGGRYEALEPGPDGAVRSEVLGLDVCEVGGRLRFRDYRAGAYLRSHTEAERATQRAERAKRQAERAKRQAERAKRQTERSAEEERRNRLRERQLRREAERAQQASDAEVARLRALLASARGERAAGDP